MELGQGIPIHWKIFVFMNMQLSQKQPDLPP